MRTLRRLMLRALCRLRLFDWCLGDLVGVEGGVISWRCRRCGAVKRVCSD